MNSNETVQSLETMRALAEFREDRPDASIIVIDEIGGWPCEDAEPEQQTMSKRDELFNERLASCADAYKNHVVERCVRDGDDFAAWCLAIKTNDECGFSNHLRTEIVMGAMRSIIIHGDVETSRFAYGPKDVNTRLRWLSGERVSDYFLEKERIGANRGSDQLEIVIELFDEDLEEYKKEFPQSALELESACNKYLNRYDDGQFRHDIYRILGSPESFGMMPSRRLFVAQAAIDRLYQLVYPEGSC